MTHEASGLPYDPLLRPEAVRDNLPLNELEMKIARLRIFAYDLEYPANTGYSMPHFISDVHDIVSYMGIYISPSQVGDYTEDPERQNILREYLEKKHPYVISSPTVVPETVQDLPLAKSFLRMVSYDTVEVQVQGADSTLELTYHDRAFIARLGFETIPTHLPRIVIIFPGNREPIQIIDAATSKPLVYDPEWKIPKLDELLQAHMMIAAASLVAEVDRIREQEATQPALFEESSASAIPVEEQ